MSFDLYTSNYATVKNTEYQLVVLPWGATEPHNLHLPYLTDALLSQSVATAAACMALQRFNINTMVLPAIPFGSQNPGQTDLKFCIHTRYSTQFAILSDVVKSLYHQNFRKLVIVNGHGGNCFKSMVRDLAVDYPDFLIAVVDWFTIVSPSEYFENKDDHAGEMETSVMMYFYPNVIDMTLAGDGKARPFAMESLNQKVAWVPRHWTKTTDDTGIGNPHKASAEKGKRYVEAVLEKLVLLFHDLVVKELY